jgi:hypothetical protein
MTTEKPYDELEYGTGDGMTGKDVKENEGK